jgi:type II secretory pathway component PulK
MTRRRPFRRGERGVILVLVLWVFMTLGVLALDFSSYMREDAMATLNLSDEARGYYMAIAGMNAALFEHQKKRENEPPGGAVVPNIQPDETGEDHDGDGKADDEVKFPADGVWHTDQFAGGKFAVRLAGEDGKIPLNVDLTGEEGAMYRELVKFVITNLVRGGNQTTGVDKDTEQQISEITDSIIDWRDCDDEAQLNGAESDYYMGLARPHRAKNGFFDSPEELLQIRGVTPDIFYGNDESPGLGEVFSPYPRGKELVINAGQITPQVVRALLPQMTLNDAEDFIAGRGEDPEGITLFLQQQLETFIPGIGPRIRIAEPEIIRIEARADLSQPRNQASVAAIVQMGGENDLPIVLSWLDRAPLHSDGPESQTSVPVPAPQSGSS